MDDHILKQCKKLLKAHYGVRLAGLVLYGSTARDQAGPSSDVDLLVLLKKPFDFFQELRAITEVLYPLQLESDHLISAKPAAADEFEDGLLQFYRNVRREGVAL